MAKTRKHIDRDGAAQGMAKVVHGLDLIERYEWHNNANLRDGITEISRGILDLFHANIDLPEGYKPLAGGTQSLAEGGA